MLNIEPGILLANDPTLSNNLPDFREEKSVASKKQRRKVLVVDDEHLIADTLAEILSRHGFIARAAYGGERALQVAKRFHPDIVVADILMPSMNGVELAILLRKLSRQTRILLFSGHANSAELLSEARDEGYHFEVVAKPIHPDKLLQLLQEKR
ncbi:MAG TPA: response regulator [Terriglobales bacterium]|nr:response regulator [Terriglobales bacterium]